MDDQTVRDQQTGEEQRPVVDLYDPFDRNFVLRKRKDVTLRLYDKKIVNDDF